MKMVSLEPRHRQARKALCMPWVACAVEWIQYGEQTARLGKGRCGDHDPSLFFCAVSVSTVLVSEALISWRVEDQGISVVFRDVVLGFGITEYLCHERPGQRPGQCPCQRPCHQRPCPLTHPQEGSILRHFVNSYTMKCGSSCRVVALLSPQRSLGAGGVMREWTFAPVARMRCRTATGLNRAIGEDERIRAGPPANAAR